MLVAGIAQRHHHVVTDAIGNYGLYAVFVLMLIDAVFPTASEVVMVYGGAVASGAFASQSISLFGHEFGSGAAGVPCGRDRRDDRLPRRRDRRVGRSAMTSAVPGSNVTAGGST